MIGTDRLLKPGVDLVACNTLFILVLVVLFVRFVLFVLVILVILVILFILVVLFVLFILILRRTTLFSRHQSLRYFICFDQTNELPLFSVALVCKLLADL